MWGETTASEEPVRRALGLDLGGAEQNPRSPGVKVMARLLSKWLLDLG